MPEQLTGAEADGLDKEEAQTWRERDFEQQDEEERYNGVLVLGTAWQGPRMFEVNFHTLNVKGCNRVPRPPCRVRINVINLMSTALQRSRTQGEARAQEQFDTFSILVI